MYRKERLVLIPGFNLNSANNVEFCVDIYQNVKCIVSTIK